MYLNDFKPATSEVFEAAIIARLQKMAERKQATKRDVEALINGGEHDAVKRLASNLSRLTQAIASKRSVFLKLEKYPTRGLDYGRNWYTLYFVDENGHIEKIWPENPTLAKIIYMNENNRDRNLWKWMFSSGAIGMDRGLDALDGLCYFLKEAGCGTVQITHRSDCI